MNDATPTALEPAPPRTLDAPAKEAPAVATSDVLISKYFILPSGKAEVTATVTERDADGNELAVRRAKRVYEGPMAVGKHLASLGNNGTVEWVTGITRIDPRTGENVEANPESFLENHFKQIENAKKEREGQKEAFDPSKYTS